MTFASSLPGPLVLNMEINFLDYLLTNDSTFDLTAAAGGSPKLIT
jgi:hypothetical protein